MEARLDVERILADFPAKNLRLATNRVVQDSAEGKYQYTCRCMPDSGRLGSADTQPVVCGLLAGLRLRCTAWGGSVAL